MNTLTTWAQTHPWAASAAGVAALAVAAILLRPLRRTPAAVAVAALAAAACTAYSADTSWRFAEHELGMVSTAERAAMFAAAELALLATALMARQNLRTQGAPGTPGVLVWAITGVQVIPAYSESGFVGGTVRAVVGPVLAAVLWHLAMGIELRHAKPDAESAALLAVLAREVRERLLSRLGLAVRDRSAEQISRDRWTVKAVALAAKLSEMKPGQRGRARVARRLSVAVGKAQAGASDEQRQKLLDLLAARRHAASLATIDLPSPWQVAGAQNYAPDAQSVTEVTAEVTVEAEGLDVIQTLPLLSEYVEAEPVPAVPEAYPPYPEVVPAGVQTLPLVARPVVAEKALVLASEAPRTRPEVHAEYVPEEVWAADHEYVMRSIHADEEDNPAQEDPLTQMGLGWAAKQFKDELLAGEMPSIRAIKDRLHVGQNRAKEIQDGFKQAQVAWRLAGSGATS